MLDLSKYLEKFNSFRDPREKKQKIAALIYEISFIELKLEEIELRNRILYIKGSSVLKSEIFLRKDELLKVFKERLDDQIDDIK